MRMDEQELMLQVQEGDEVSFEKIMTIYKSRIVNFIFRLTGDYEKAVELSQETFMRVYFKAKRYKPIAPLSSWIYTIASNLTKTELKKMRRYDYMPLENVHNHLASGIAVNEDHENSAMVKELKKTLNSLHPRYRIPVVLKDIEGFTQEEIAEMLRKPIGTIKARISRGRNHLKEEMEKASLQINNYTEEGEYKNGRI
jgi:RNA polymerase sigma-70 factor (ECF subfamily)